MERRAWEGLINLEDGKRTVSRLHKKLALRRRLFAKAQRRAAILREISKIQFDQKVLNDDCMV